VPTNSRQCHRPAVSSSATQCLKSLAPPQLAGLFLVRRPQKRTPSSLVLGGSREVVASVWASGRAAGVSGRVLPLGRALRCGCITRPLQHNARCRSRARRTNNDLGANGGHGVLRLGLAPIAVRMPRNTLGVGAGAFGAAGWKTAPLPVLGDLGGSMP
jgi:hypothetical protein